MLVGTKHGRLPSALRTSISWPPRITRSPRLGTCPNWLVPNPPIVSTSLSSMIHTK